MPRYVKKKGKRWRCRKCKYSWVGRRIKPKQCPNCKQNNIDKPKKRK